MQRDVEGLAGADPGGPVGAVDRSIPLSRWLLALGLVLVNVADVWITKLILLRGGVETNPVMRPIIDHPAAPILVKTLVAVAVGILLIASPPTSKFAGRAVGAVLLLYVVILGWNIGVLLQAVEATRF